MPNRILKESICTSSNLNLLSSEAEVLFYRMITMADDFGRFDARPQIIRARCFPLRVERISNEEIENYLAELVNSEVIQLYTVDGNNYGLFTTWELHQRIRNKISKIPAPNGNSNDLNPYYLARFISGALRKAIYQRDKYKCLKCGTGDSELNPLSIDHIIPVNEKGTSDENNLQTLCLRCNLIKNTKTIDYRKVAASRSKLLQVAAESVRNPIQSNPNTNTNIYTNYGEFNNVKLKEDEYKRLVERFSEAGVKERIEELSRGIASKGYKYKSHYATILNWERFKEKNGVNQRDPRQVPKRYTRPEEL